MASIKRRGVVAGGTAAGVVLMGSGTVLAALIFPGPAGMADGHAPGLVTPLLLRLAIGFVLVLVYVGFRPRFGPGRRAIVAATVAVWLAWSWGIVTAAVLFPILPPLRVALVVVWGLIELTLACTAGAALYRRHVAAVTRKRGRSVSRLPHG